MKCQVCGAESSGKFCEFCGAPLQEANYIPGQEPGSTTPMQQDPFQAGYAPQDQAGYQGYQDPYQASYEATQQQQAPYYAQQPQGAPGAPTMPGVSGVPVATGPQASSAPFVLAIIALVMAVLGLFPIAIILAIIALVMNSGQKKRGETSTKQTPTFVMSIISIIISAIQFILVIMLGGVVWMAAMDGDLDDIDISSNPGVITIGTTTPIGSTTDSPAVGTWEAVSLSIDGESFDEEYLDLMREFDMGVEIELDEDGIVTFSLVDEIEIGTWEDKGNGKIVLDFDGEKVNATISGDTMTLFDDDGTDDEMIFRRAASEDEDASSISGTLPSASSSSAA